jgi:hypothetical protein
MARRIFENKIQQQRQTNAETLMKYINKVAREEAIELEVIEQRKEQADNLLNQTENENQKLKELIDNV